MPTCNRPRPGRLLLSVLLSLAVALLVLVQTPGRGHVFTGHDVPAPWETGIEVELTLGAEVVDVGQVVDLAVFAEDYDHCSLPDCPWPQGKTLDPLTLHWSADNAELGTLDEMGQFQPVPHSTSPVTHFRCTAPGEAWIHVVADDAPVYEFMPGGADRYDDHERFAVGRVSVVGHLHWPVLEGDPIPAPELVLPAEVFPGELVDVQFTPGADLDLCGAEGCPLPQSQILDAVVKFGWHPSAGDFGFLDGAGQWNPTTDPAQITHWKAPAAPGAVTLSLLLDDVAAFWDPVLQQWWPAFNDTSLLTDYQIQVLEDPGGPHEHSWTPEQLYRIKTPGFTAGTGATDQVLPLNPSFPLPGDEDYCVAAGCPIPQRTVANAVVRTWSDGGGGGQFGYMQGPEFVPTTDHELVTHYKCPSTTGNVTLSITLDDVWQGVPDPGSGNLINTDDDPPVTVQKVLTVTLPMHQHQWADSVNEARWPIFLQRNGQDVASVVAGEVLSIRKGVLERDTDVCLAGGCPFGGTAYEPPSLHEIQSYRDDRGGRFGRLDAQGVFEPLPPTMFSAITHYQPPPYLAGGDSVCVWIDIDDAGVAPYPEMPEDEYYLSKDDPPTTGDEAKDSASCYPVTDPGVLDQRQIDPDDSCGCATCAPGNSSIDPRTGAVRFEVPITSWPFRGTELGLSLHYDSNSRADPRLRTADRSDMHAHPDFAHFSYRNSKWSHNWAQFVEVIDTGTGEWTALWHTGDGGVTPFHVVGAPNRHSPTYQPQWISDDSYHSLVSAGQTRIWLQVDGANVERVLPYGSFAATDAGGTVYTFAHTYVEKGAMAAVPYFLLTRVQDRLGRRVDLVWSGRLLQRVKDDAGKELVFSYQENNRCTSVSDPWGRSHTFAYAVIPEVHSGFPAQRLTSATVKGPGLTAVTWSWSFDYGTSADQQNYYGGSYTGDLVIRKREPNGRVVHYAYAGVGTMREEPGDWDGRLLHTWYYDRLVANGPPTLFDTERLGTTLVYPGGRSVTYAYSGHDLSSITNDETGHSIAYTRDSLGNLRTIRTSAEPEGTPALVEIEYEFAADQRTIVKATLTNPLGEETEIDFTQLWNLPYLLRQKRRTVDGQPYDRVTQWQYGPGGRLNAVTTGSQPYGQQLLTFSYGDANLPGVPTGAQDLTGRDWRFVYDTFGRPTEIQSPPNNAAPVGHPDRLRSVTRFKYRADGILETLTDPDGRSWRMSATGSSSSLLVSMLRPGQQANAREVYDAGGNLTGTVDELGAMTRAEYSLDGRLLESVEGAGSSLERTTRYEYNVRGELVRLVPPKGTDSAVAFDYRAYNQSGVLLPATRQEGRVTRILHPGGNAEYFGYDAHGRPDWSGRMTGNGLELTAVVTARDALHRVTEVTIPPGTGTTGYTASVVYDEFGRVRRSTDATGETLYTYDSLDRPTQIVPPGPRHPIYFSYSYNPGSHIDTTTVQITNANGPEWAFATDAKGRDGGLLDPAGNALAYEYYPSGRVWKRHINNPTSKRTTYSYQGDTLASIWHEGQVESIDTFTYQRDAVGRVTRETDAGGRVHEYQYDVLGQLIRETHPDLGSGIDYAYDSHGNRTSVTRNGVTEWYGVNAADQLLWTNTAGNFEPTLGQSAPFNLFGYDSAGNMVTRTRKTSATLPERSLNFAWTADGRLASVSEGTWSRFTATYAADGERVSKTDITGTTTYNWGLLDENGAEWHMHSPGIGYRGWDAAFRYTHEDHLGSTRYISTNQPSGFPELHEDIKAALRYDAYGNVTQAAGDEIDGSATAIIPPARRQYAGAWGYEREPPANGLGLDYLYQRYYDPAIGRFISRDPIGWAGGLNLYGYVDNDPVNFTDPTGRRKTGSYWGDVLETLKGEAIGLLVQVNHQSNPLNLISDAAGFAGELAGGWRNVDWTDFVPLSDTYWAFQNENDPLLAGVMIGGDLPTAAAIAMGVRAGCKRLATWRGTEPSPVEPYNRRKHYGSTPTASDRRAIGGSPDHNPPLVKRYYEGDPAIGEPAGHKQTPAERRQGARDRSRMLRSTLPAQRKQGAEMSRYSKQQKRKYGFK